MMYESSQNDPSVMQVMARLLVPPMQVRGETTVQNGSRMTSYYPPERSDASKLPLAPILSAFFFSRANEDDVCSLADTLCEQTVSGVAHWQV